MLVTMKELLSVAHKNKFAVGAFNIGSSEFLKVVLETAEENESPLILAIHPTELDYLTESFVSYARDAASRSRLPIVLHLDHGEHLEDIIRAIRCGFTSVMIDASKKSFEENIQITSEIVSIAKTIGVSVEAELGHIGQAESNIEGEITENDDILYTDPMEAKEFVERTGIDTLAVAIGTAHGMYPKNQKPKLQIERLRKISSLVPIPLVLHGGSDNSDEEVMEAIQLGISKVNLSSEMKKAFFSQSRKILFEDQREYEPQLIFPSALAAAKEVIKHKMDVFGSTGKKHLFN